MIYTLLIFSQIFSLSNSSVTLSMLKNIKLHPMTFSEVKIPDEYIASDNKYFIDKKNFISYTNIKKNVTRKTPILIMPGLCFSRFTMLSFAEQFADDGYDTYIVSPPGQGESSGKGIGLGITEAPMLEKFIVDKFYNPVMLSYSYSTLIASQISKTNIKFKALIFISPILDINTSFNNYLNLTRNKEKDKTYYFNNELFRNFGTTLDQYKSNIDLKNTKFPTLIIGSDKDEVTKFSEYFKLCQNNSKIFCAKIKNYSHVDFSIKNREYFDNTILKWLNNL